MINERPNVIFIMLDTLSTDHLKMYGGRIKMGNLERIGGDGVIYKNAIAPGTYTLPSHASLFTNKRVRRIRSLVKDPIKNHERGTDPLQLKNKYIGDNEMTLAKQMSYLGYKTSLLSNNPFITSSTGLGTGFSFIKNIFIEKRVEAHKASLGLIGNDMARKNLTRLAYYISRFIPEKSLDKLYVELRHRLNKRFNEESEYYSLDQGAELTNSTADDYLSKTGSRGHFMFLNYMEAHESYPTNMLTDKFVSQDRWMYVSRILGEEDVQILRKAYEKRLGYLDKKIGNLMAILKNRGILENAVVVMTSDHGQAFMEHGQLFHALFPYNEISKVPLVVGRYKDSKQVRVGEVEESNVSLSALNGAISEIGYGKIDSINGTLRKDRFVFSDHIGQADVWDIGLLRLLKGRSKNAEKIYKAKLKYNSFASAVYYNNYKLIHYSNKRIPNELYDMENDPKESENIIEGNRSLARQMLDANRAA